MRIGIDITPLIQEKWSGVHHIIYKQTKRLIEDNPRHQFVLFAITPRARADYLSILDITQRNNVQLRTIRVYAKLFHFVTTTLQFLGYPKVETFTGKLDIWHSYDWFTFRSNAPSTVTIFDLTTELFPNWHTPKNVRAQRYRLKNAKRHCQHFFAISQQTKRDIVELLRISEQKISIVYPDCDPLFAKKDRVQVLLPEALAPHTNKYFLYVGTIEPRKNLARVVKAFTHLPKSTQKKHPLIIIGSFGWKVNRLAEKIKKNSNILHLGYIENDQLVTIYSHARALLYPSLYEGFGIPVLEAIRASCLVITSNVSSMPEVAADAAIYVNPKSVQSIKEGIQKAVNLKTIDVKKLTGNASKHAQKFNYSISGNKMMKVWSGL